MKEVTVNKNDAGQRLDKFLGKAFPRLKKSMMYKALRNKKIKVNRKRADYANILQEGDVILLFLPEDVLAQEIESMPSSPSAVSKDGHGQKSPDAPKIRVVFENRDLLVVFKPEGLLSQKDSRKKQDTMAQQIIDHLERNGSYDPKEELSFVPAAVSRLDRNTSGLCAAGKNAAALRKLNACVREHTLKKFYLARVQGVIPQDELRLRMFLKKEQTIAKISREELPGYVNADMNIRVVSRSKTQTLIEAELLTGRFHQIRASLAFLGYPLVGDHKYGYQGEKSRQELCAWRLDFSKTPFAEQIENVSLLPADIPWIRPEEYPLVEKLRCIV